MLNAVMTADVQTHVSRIVVKIMERTLRSTVLVASGVFEAVATSNSLPPPDPCLLSSFVPISS